MYQSVQSRSVVQSAPQPAVLSSWKEIAAYVGKGVRTVQRWELQHRFPVRRPAGAGGGVVIAIPAELDAWIARNQVIAMPALIDAWMQDTVSNGEGSAEEELANLRAENADLREQVAELRAGLTKLDQANQRRACD